MNQTVKIFFTVFVLFLFLLPCYSQGRHFDHNDIKSITEQGRSDAHFFDKEHERNYGDTIESSVLKRFNSNFKVLDSTDYFNGSEEEWLFESRYRAVEFDPFGNVLRGETRFYNEAANSWSHKSRASFRYREPARHIRDYYLNQVWDSENNIWLDETYAKYFGDNGYTELYVKDWNFKRNKFTGGYRYYYTLNEQNLAAERLVQKWDTVVNSWVNDMHYSYSYTSFKKPQEIILKIWYKTINNWVTARKDYFEFDQSGNNTVQTIQYWSSYLGWINGYMFRNHFNSLNKTDIVEAYKWNPSRSVWEDIQRNEYLYDSDGNLKELIINKKNAGALEYSKSQRMYYNYDRKGNQVLYLNQTWKSDINEWINVARLIHEYNPQGKMVKKLQQKWDSTNQTWIDDFRELSDYVRNGFNIEYLKQTWDQAAGRWINVEKRLNYYSGFKNDNGPVITDPDNHDKITTGTQMDKGELKYTVFPNPASEMVSIRFENADQLKIRRADLFDAYGRLIKSYTVKENSELTISRGALKSGRYLLSFTGDKTFSTVLIFE